LTTFIISSIPKLDSCAVFADAAEASLVVVSAVDGGIIGGIATAVVGRTVGTVGAITGGWEVDSPCHLTLLSPTLAPSE